MALKQRRDDKMWKEIFNFYFIVIILGLLYLILLVTSEPVCYTRISVDERNLNIKRVDCDGTETICKRSASKKDVRVVDLLNSPCRYPDAHPSTHKKDNKATTCQEVHLPTVNAGFFNCSGYSVGDKCNLTCDDDNYPSATKYTICEDYDDHKANWTVGKFLCSAIKCSTTNLPTVSEGSFDCSPNLKVSMGEACTLTCNNESYPVYSSQAVCEAGIPNQGGVWSNGNFVCRRRKGNDWNEWNGSEYKFTSTWHTWVGSRQLCESDNSHLVTIGNKEENEFVHQMVQHTHGHQYHWAWIGLTDSITEDTWEWIDGTVSTYRKWNEGQPDGGDAHDCVYMYQSNGEWYDELCTSLLSAVCERNNPLT